MILKGFLFYLKRLKGSPPHTYGLILDYEALSIYIELCVCIREKCILELCEHPTFSHLISAFVSC